MRDVSDESARADDFASGEEDVRDTLRVLRQLAGPAFEQDRILDFGCGNGRLTVPLARVAQHVVAADVDPAALAAAAEHCREAGLANVTFVESRPGLDDIAGPFEIVHSRDVFQHLEPSVGYAYAGAVLDRVTTRGGGMLHFTYAGPPDEPRGIARRSQEVVLRLLYGESGEAMSLIHDYDLNRVIGMLQSKRFDRVATRFTVQDGHSGVKVFFWRGY